MKTFSLTLITLIIVTSFGVAQTTLTNLNNPSPGNVNIYLTCDTANISEGSAGPNRTWNFTSLSFNDSSAVSYVASSSTPYSSQFPTSNIASTTDDSTYSYATASQTNLIINGNAGSGMVIPYTDSQLFMQYPFTFNSSFTDAFSANFVVSGINTFRTGTTAVTGDAWGQINLPNGSFTNALRVKYVTTTRDSSNVGISVIVITNLTSYVWFVPGKKFPVFEIIYSNVTFNGTPFGSYKTVNYTPNNIPIGISNISTETPSRYNLSQNYPNPFNPVTNLEFEISKFGLVSLKIYDMIGKEIANLISTNLSPGKYNYNFDASDLASGIYFYTLKVNEFSVTKKMNLVK